MLLDIAEVEKFLLIVQLCVKAGMGEITAQLEAPGRTMRDDTADRYENAPRIVLPRFQVRVTPHICRPTIVDLVLNAGQAAEPDG